MINPTTLNPTLFEIMRELVAVRGSLDRLEERWNDPIALVARLNELAPTVMAEFNHAHWLATCPRCQAALTVDPSPEWREIEGAEWPRHTHEHGTSKMTGVALMGAEAD